MKTIKLFEENAFLSTFEAAVLSCEPVGNIFKIILDKTCFFPEAGGQPSDIGVLDNINVTDAQIENGEIVHFCEDELKPGQIVTGKIDFDRRFCFMQNHSGEHIVSGIVNRLYSLDNVGFHLNEEFVTLDFNAVLSKEQIITAEYLANKAVWENRKVRAFYPTGDELKNISFRQKAEIKGDIRLVEIEGVDVCACCAPHIDFTGQIGQIKLIDFEKMRGGTRIYMKCGEYALNDHREKQESVKGIMNALSVSSDGVFEGVTALKQRYEELKSENSDLRKKLLTYMAEEITDKVSFIKGLSMSELQKLCDILYKRSKATCVCFSENGENTFNIVIRGDDDEVNTLCLKAKENLALRGGGRNGMISGIVSAEKEEIIKELSI